MIQQAKVLDLHNFQLGTVFLGSDHHLPISYVQPHIPLDSQIREGRYPFDPRQLNIHR